MSNIYRNNNSLSNYNNLKNFALKYNRNTSSNNDKKFNFKHIKKNTCESLNDIEHFLCNFSTFVKYIKLYNLLK